MGILGFVVVSSVIALRRAARVSSDLGGVLFVATVGTLALLVAAGSNPYLQAAGHMWPVFLPFMIANAILAPVTTSKDGLVIPPWLGLRRSKPAE